MRSKPDPTVVRAKAVMFAILGRTVQGSIDEVAGTVQDYVEELSLERSENSRLRTNLMLLEQDLQEARFTIRRMRAATGEADV